MKYIFIAIMAIVLLAAVGHKVFATENLTQSKIELTTKNHVVLRDEVNANSVNTVLQGITNSDPTKVFYIVLDSPGGQVLAGGRLVNYLLSTDRNIVCIAQTAISMAFVTLQACPVRIVTPHTILMSHQIAGGAQGSLKEMKAAVAFAEKLSNMYETMIANRLKLTLEAYRAKINPEFWMIGAKDAIENNAADTVVSVSCSKELEKSFYLVGEGKDAIKVSNCPIA